MKLYRINKWNELYENSRSRVVIDLQWVAIPNRHDGENFSMIMLHEKGSMIFSAFILMLQIASKCSPRGSLVRDNGTPHNAISLSVKCRAPVTWFEVALEYLENNTDWLDIEEVTSDYHQAVTVPSPSRQSSAEERRKEWKEGNGNLPSSLSPKQKTSTVPPNRWDLQKKWLSEWPMYHGGESYVWDIKDDKAADKLLSKHSPDKIMEVLRQGWQSNKSFIQSVSSTLSNAASKWNDIVAAIKSKPQINVPNI